MKTTSITKRLYALILAIAMILQIAPVSALADDLNRMRSNQTGGQTFFTVNFYEGENLLRQLIAENGTISVTPEKPFREGARFVEWNTKADGKGEKVDVGYSVTGDLDVYAIFESINIYTIKVHYFYMRGENDRVDFDQTTEIVDGNTVTDDNPLTITSPSETEVDAATQHYNNAQGLIFYPTMQTVSVTKERLLQAVDGVLDIDVQYVPYTATFSYVYMLQDLNDKTHYTEITAERVNGVQGVLNSLVTPTVKNLPYAVFEKTQPVKITQASGMELPVYYTRKELALFYDTQGGVAVDPVTTSYGAKITLAAGTTREGYTFRGWYASKEDAQNLTNPITSVTISDTTTVYAGWEGNEVGYTVVYMLEKYNNGSGSTSFEYDRFNDDVTAQVGTTVCASDAPELTNNINGYEPDTEQNANSTVEIKADGSSVLTVYYKLIRYTIVFNAATSYQYGYGYQSLNVDGKINKNGAISSTYTISNVVLGQDVSSLWPTSGTEVYTADKYYNTYDLYFAGWDGAPGGVQYLTRQNEIIWNHVQAANNNHVMTFTAHWTIASNIVDATYWLQQPDGSYVSSEEYAQIGLNISGSLIPKDLDGYSIHIENVTQNNSGSYVRDDSRSDTNAIYYEFSGHYYRSAKSDEYGTRYTIHFTPENYDESGNTIKVWTEAGADSYKDNGGHKSQTPSSSEQTISRNGVTYSFDHAESYKNSQNKTRYYYWYTNDERFSTDQQTDTYTYRYYYDRAQYTIEFRDGGTSLKTTDPIYFEASIANENYTPANPAGKQDYTFGGWYANSDLQGDQFAFDTMPGHNVILYAKWIAPNYSVKFLNNFDSTDTSVFDSQTVDKGQKANDPGIPSRQYYSFQGWYTSAEGGTRYYPGTQVVNADITLYAQWKLDSLQYTVRYLEKDTNKVLFSEKVTKSPLFTVGQEITEVPVSVVGYLPLKGTETIHLSYKPSENIITFYYGEKLTDNTYTVYYVLRDNTSVEVNEKKTVTISGKTSQVTEMAAAVDTEKMAATGASAAELAETYYPEDDTKTLQLTQNVEDNVITFTYVPYKNARFTISWVDMDGNQIPGTSVETQSVKVGGSVQINTSVSGYTLSYIWDSINQSTSRTNPLYIVNDGGAVTVKVYMKKNLTITAKPKTWPYDGQPHSSSGVDDIEVSGLLEDDTITSVSYSGSITNVSENDKTTTPSGVTGIHNGSVSFDTYYAINYQNGTLSIEPQKVSIYFDTDRWNDGPAYNGVERVIGFRSNDSIRITSSLYDQTYGAGIRQQAAAISMAKTDAGPAETGYKYTLPITKDMFTIPEDSNYTVTVEVRDGELTINPVELTAKTGSAVKAYDGTPLTNDEASLTGFVNNESATIVATGSQTEIGSSDNFYSITWDNAKSSNYTITDDLGLLEVKQDYKVTYSVSGQVPTGYSVPTDGTHYKEGDKALIAAAPSEYGYVFTGWTYDEKTYDNSNLTIGTSDVEMTGVWAYDQFEVVFNKGAHGDLDGQDANGDVKHTADYLSDTPAAPAVTAEEGWYFTGWSPEIEETVTGDALYVAQYAEQTEVSLTVEDDVTTYSGVEQTSTQAVAESELKEGHSWSYNYAPAKGTDATTEETKYAGSFTNVKVVDSEGNDVSEQYIISTTAGKLAIDPRKITLTANDANNEYTGGTITYATAADAVSPYYTMSGTLAKDQSITAIELTGEGVEVGEYDIEITEGSVEIGEYTANYKITLEKGTLAITANTAEIVVVPGDGEKEYDGTPLTKTAHDDFTVTGVPEGFTWTATADGTVTNVKPGDGEKATNAVTSFIIYDADGADVTDQFSNIDKSATATLTITTKPVTITAQDHEFTYNGTAQSWPEYDVDGLVGDDALTAVVEGSITFPSESEKQPVPNVVKSHEFTAGDAKNYSVSYKDGALTMKKANRVIVIQAMSTSWPYDGYPHEDSTVFVAEGDLFDGDELDARAEGSVTNVADGEGEENQENNKIVDGYKIMHGNVDVTDNYAITPEHGHLAIYRASLTVTFNDTSKTYGDPDPTFTYRLDGIVKGNTEDEVRAELEEGNMSKEITREYGKDGKDGEDVGEYVIKETLDATETTANYKITYVEGKLTINPRPITLTAASEDFEYNGDDHQPTPYGDLNEFITDGSLRNGDYLKTVRQSGIVTDVKDNPTEANPFNNEIMYDNYDGLVIERNSRKVTDNYDITLVGGALTIIPAELTITVEDRTLSYNGETQYGWSKEDEGKVTIKGLKHGETVEISYTPASGTDVAAEPYTGTFDASTLKIIDSSRMTSVEPWVILQDYNVTYVPGKLTILPPTLTIRYWLNGLDGELINTISQQMNPNTAYDIATPPIEGYTPDIARVTGVLTKDTEVDVIYTINAYTLTIQYLFEDGGEAAPTYTAALNYGAAYSVDSPAVDGFNTATPTVAGTMPDRNVTVTVFYLALPVAPAPAPAPDAPAAAAGPFLVNIDDLETPLGLGLFSINAGETIE